MNRVKLLLSPCLLALSLGVSSNVYADSVVAPNANTSANGNAVQFLIVGNPVGSHFQTDIAASQLTSLIGQSIDAIGFRLPGGAASIPSDTVTGFTMELSGSANPIGSLSSTFSANIGADPQTVSSGTLVLTGLTGGAGPNPFFLINFSAPYLYTGGDLLITTSYITTSATFGVDANSIGSVSGIENTVGNTSPGDTTGTVGFFNAPVVEFVTTPEPGSLTLLGTGLAGLAAMLRRRFV